MKTFEPQVNIRQDLTKKRKDGLSPLYIHIQWDKTRAKESTGIYLNEKDYKNKLWKSDKKLKKRLVIINERINELMSSHKPFTAKDCLNKVESKLKPETILLEMASIKRLEHSTVSTYFEAVNSLKRYFGDFTLDELSLFSIQGYSRATGVSPVTMCTYLKKLHSLLNYAVQKGYLKSNVMDGWNFRGEGFKWKDKPRSRTRGDILKIITEWRKGNEAAGIWLSGYFFCGLALTDLMRVEWDKVREEWIGGSLYYRFTLNRKKTRETASVTTPVTELTKSLLELLRRAPWERTKNYKRYVNLELKKIDSTLTYYQCRHSFCSMMVASGVPVNVIASMMGRAVSGISAYIARISESESLSKAADALRRTEIIETPPEDLFLD